MKLGLVSPDILFTFGFLSERPLTILLSLSETAIFDLFRSANVIIKPSMILRTFNTVLSWVPSLYCYLIALGLFRSCFAIVIVK